MNIYVPRCYSFRGDIFLLFDNWSADAQPFCSSEAAIPAYHTFSETLTVMKQKMMKRTHKMAYVG